MLLCYLSIKACKHFVKKPHSLANTSELHLYGRNLWFQFLYVVAIALQTVFVAGNISKLWLIIVIKTNNS